MNVLSWSTVVLFCCFAHGLAIRTPSEVGLEQLLKQKNCGRTTSYYPDFDNQLKLSSRPWMALLQFRTQSGKVATTCTGTLITERYVLTAAHCFETGTLVSVRLGDHNRATAEDCQFMFRKRVCQKYKDYEVEKQLQHIDYINGADDTADIALIKLATDVEFTKQISPICLPINKELSKPAEKMNAYFVTGWGLLENPKSSDELLETYRYIEQRKSCTNNYNRELTDSQLCAISTSKDECNADSGGPLSSFNVYIRGQRVIQYGIVSYGQSDCNLGHPAVYTNVAYFIPWIVETIGSE